jgi:pimeloyl-ACP methyl ester carboxylesterase
MTSLSARRYGPPFGEALPSIVVLPGFGVSRYLRAACERLAQRLSRPVHLVEPPGFGANRSTIRGSVTVAAVVAVLREWLAHFGPVVLVGQSTGCVPAARLARDDSRLDIRGLALTGPVFAPSATASRAMAGLARDAVREPWWLGPVEVPEWLGNARAMRSYLKSCLPEPLDRHLDAGSCPVIIARGENDPMCEHVWAARLADAPRRTLVTVPGGSHTYMAGRPDALAESLIAGGFDELTVEST